VSARNAITVIASRSGAARQGECPGVACPRFDRGQSQRRGVGFRTGRLRPGLVGNPTYA